MIRTHVMTGLIALGTLGASVWADEAATAGTEQRLQQVERDLQALQASQEQLNQKLSRTDKKDATLVRAAGKEEAIKFGGMLQMQMDGGDKGDRRFNSDNERFYLRRARLGATAQFEERIEVRIEGEFSGTLAESSAMRAQLTDGYIHWSPDTALQLRLGQFKTPFGFEQLASDPRLYTIERSLGNDRLTLSRQIGAQLSGDVLQKRLSYAAGAFNGTSINTSSNDNSRFLFIGRLGLVAIAPEKGSNGPRLAFGINGYASEDDNLTGQPGEFKFNTSTNSAANNVFAGERTGWGADAQFSVGRIECWAEYLTAHYKPDNALPRATLDADAWYVQAMYTLIKDKLLAVAKYDTFDPNTDAANDETDTWTLGVSYCIRGNDLKLQLNYLQSDIQERDATDQKVIARVQVLF